MYAHAQAPVRIGIAGGGTDLPAWTATRTGRCLSLAIAAYTHAVAIARPDGQVVASYRRRDSDRSATEIANGLIREGALLHGWEDGFEVHTLSELSSRGSGLGVSSSIAVALAACFHRLRQLRDGGLPTQLSSMRVAKDAWTAEIDKLRRPIGRQDHMAAAHGGLKMFSFTGDAAAVERSFSKEDADWVAEHLALVQLPAGHDSRVILSKVKDPGVLGASAEAVPVAVEAIEKRSVALLGRALIAGQVAKFRISGMVTAEVADALDRIGKISVTRALDAVGAGAENGIYGCKVAGAGGGGHVVVACVPSAHGILAEATGLPVIAVKADYEGVRSEGWA